MTRFIVSCRYIKPTYVVAIRIQVSGYPCLKDPPWVLNGDADIRIFDWKDKSDDSVCFNKKSHDIMFPIWKYTGHIYVFWCPVRFLWFRLAAFLKFCMIPRAYNDVISVRIYNKWGYNQGKFGTISFVTQYLITHLLFIECADWQKLRDMFKARDTTIRQGRFSVSAGTL